MVIMGWTVNCFPLCLNDQSQCCDFVPDQDIINVAVRTVASLVDKDGYGLKEGERNRKKISF